MRIQSRPTRNEWPSSEMTSICRTWWSSSITTCCPVSRASQCAIDIFSSDLLLVWFICHWAFSYAPHERRHWSTRRALRATARAQWSRGRQHNRLHRRRRRPLRAAPRGAACASCSPLLSRRLTRPLPPPNVTARTRVPGARALSADSSIAYHSTRFPRAALGGAAKWIIVQYKYLILRRSLRTNYSRFPYGWIQH